MLLKREMDVDNDSDGHLQRALPLLGKTPDTHRQASMYRLLSVIISCSGYTVNVVAVSGDVTYNYALHAQAIQPRHSYYLRGQSPRMTRPVNSPPSGAAGI